MTLSEWWQQAQPRERDMLIAEKVMGNRRKRPYSTSLSAAWTVAQHMNRKSDEGGSYGLQGRFVGLMQQNLGIWYVDEATAAGMVCMACLAAVGITEVDYKGE